MTEHQALRFEEFALENWRQFDRVAIRFDSRLTILTGANGSGKSTILTLLARHFEWSRSYSAAPRRTKGGTRWTTLPTPMPNVPGNRVGMLEYSDGFVTALQAPLTETRDASQYDVTYDERRVVDGLFLTSHRWTSGNYSPIDTIPALFGGPEQIFNQVTNISRSRWMGQWGGKSPFQALKESLIAAAAFGEGNASIEPNREARDVWSGFTQLLAQIFPSSLGYRGLRVRVPEVIVETDGEDFIIDEVSGGLSALIEIAWQIFLRSRSKGEFSVLIDEPENHLHPSLQREVLPALLRAFPDVQFVIATHSPFVITASPQSAVYVLDYDDRRRVFSRRLDYATKASSADETLRRVLGLDSTMPIWAEHRFEEILAEFLPGGLSPNRLAELRLKLQESGLASEFPSALMAASEKRQGGEE